MRQMVPLEEAQELMLKRVQPLEKVEQELLQSIGLVLAEDIMAPHPLPPFDRSLLDGYALQAADSTAADVKTPVRLRITETIQAGSVATGRVEPGFAVAIASGAPLPPGADCVVRFEVTRREGEFVYIYYPLSAGENVNYEGEDFAACKVALPAGRVLNPPALALLAALGYQKVMVHRRPRVAIFSTGDELLTPGRHLSYGKIYNSNLYAIAAQVEEAGGEAVLLDNVVDDETLISKQFILGQDQADLVVSTGGVSVGERDVVKKAMRGAGAELLFWKAALKPGTPVTCSLREGRLLIGLSGNPAAAMVTFSLLVRPLLRRMAGCRELFLTRVNARLSQNFLKGGSQRRFVRAVVHWQDGYIARPAGRQAPGALKSLVEGNALIDIPAGHGSLKAGQLVDVLLL